MGFFAHARIMTVSKNVSICFEAFFDWLICKILSSDWSIECFEVFVASSGPQPKIEIGLDFDQSKQSSLNLRLVFFLLIG